MLEAQVSKPCRETTTSMSAFDESTACFIFCSEGPVSALHVQNYISKFAFYRRFVRMPYVPNRLAIALPRGEEINPQTAPPPVSWP